MDQFFMIFIILPELFFLIYLDYVIINQVKESFKIKILLLKFYKNNYSFLDKIINYFII